MRIDAPRVNGAYALPPRVKEAFDLLKQAAWDWLDDQAPTLGAAVAYYTVFSLAPLLIIAVSIAGLVFGQEAAQGQIFDQLRTLVGEASAGAMEDVVESANSTPATGVVATIIGFVALDHRRFGGFRADADFPQFDLGR